ncbi:MAG: hypothetical protein GY715_08690 [Planctomycetes bacterium]|nr:hypothetical protein [Planctomycetota bacterium]
MYLAGTFTEIIDQGLFVPFLVIGGGLCIAALAIIFGTIKHIAVAKEREQTKRELSAYVAEGTLDPDKAVAILKADRPRWEVDKSDLA